MAKQFWPRPEYSEASSIHSATHEYYGDMSDPGPLASPWPLEVTVAGAASGQLCYAFHSISGEPGVQTWPAAGLGEPYRLKIEVTTAGADVTYEASSGTGGHAARVASGLSGHVGSNFSLGAAQSGTGIRQFTNTMQGEMASGSATDRLEVVLAASNSNMMAQTLTIAIRHENTYIQGPFSTSSTIELTPTPVAVDLAVPAPTLAYSAVTLSPASVLLDLGVPAPTLGLSLSLTGTPVPLDLAVPAPTLGLSLALAPAAVPVDLGVLGAAVETIADVELAPGPVALLLAVPAPTLGQSLSLAPAPVALGTAVPAASVGVGALTLAPAAVLVDLGVPASSVSTGSAPIELTPTPVVLLLAVPSPTLGLGAVTLSPSSVVLDLSISPPIISTPLSIAVDPVLVALGVPGGLVFESGVPIELAPGAVGLDLGVLGAQLGLALALSPGPVGLSLATPASLVEPGALALQATPVVLSLGVTAVGQVGPLQFVTGSDVTLVEQMAAFWDEYDAATTDEERRQLLRYWLLTHGAVRRYEDGFLTIKGGIFPVRVTPSA